MLDWAAVATWAGIGLALLSAAISYGMSRQEVSDLRTRVEANEKQIAELSSVRQSVEMLAQSTSASHTLMRTEAKAAQDLSTQAFESLRGELRAFMQGQASAGGTRPPAPRRKASQ